MAGLDVDDVRHALTTARKLGYREVELAVGEEHFHAVLEPAPKPVEAPADQTVASIPSRSILAPVVGYFRAGKVPLEVGKTIKKGDHVGVIVALGIANDLESRWSGTVTEVLVAPDQPVDFGKVLARITEE